MSPIALREQTTADTKLSITSNKRFVVKPQVIRRHRLHVKGIGGKVEIIKESSKLNKSETRMVEEKSTQNTPPRTSSAEFKLSATNFID